MPNFIKIGHTVVRYGDLMVFKMAGIRHLGFLGRVLGQLTKTT